MASLYDLFAANEDSAENGKWFDFGDTIKVKIRRFKSKKSRKVREELDAPYKRASKFGTTLPDDVSEDIANRHVARGIIVDWKGVTSKTGEEVPFSADAALKLIRDLPEFRDAIVELSLSLDAFRDDEKLEIEGN